MSADKSVSVAPTEDQDDAFEEEVSDTSKEVNLIETGLVPPAKRRVVG